MNLGKMNKQCNNIVVVIGLMACLLVVKVSCYVMESPATENNTKNLKHRRLISRPFFGLTDSTTFSYYLLALQWPPSACATGMVCGGHIPTEFTIHGLWPQDSNGKGLPPYEANTSCTTLRPTPPNQIMGILQKGNLVGELTRVWPTLKNTSSAQQNQQFWEYEWGRHGMCTDYGDMPYDYFKAAINLRDHFVQVFKLEPGRAYKVQEVVDNVKAAVKGTPEIACRNKKGGHGSIIVAEVRLCYEKGNVKPEGIRDCKKPYSGVCKSMVDEVTFV